ncbi:hypothetical protein VDGL01_08960 [Verticillium dahliae]
MYLLSPVLSSIHLLRTPGLPFLAEGGRRTGEGWMEGGRLGRVAARTPNGPRALPGASRYCLAHPSSGPALHAACCTLGCSCCHGAAPASAGLCFRSSGPPPPPPPYLQVGTLPSGRGNHWVFSLAVSLLCLPTPRPEPKPTRLPYLPVAQVFSPTLHARHPHAPPPPPNPLLGALAQSPAPSILSLRVVPSPPLSNLFPTHPPPFDHDALYQPALPLPDEPRTQS